MKKLMLFSTVILVVSGLPQNVHAQDSENTDKQEKNEIEVIMVSSERRIQSSQDIAASIEVRNGDELRKQGKYTIQQILEDIPNVMYFDDPQNDNLAANIIIRGAVPNESAAGNVTVPTTAVYVDGIYGGVGSNYDVGRVEVLRGPQGTLYGRSATSGVVAFYTNNPELDDFTADLTLEAGNYSRQHGTLVINTPLSDTLAMRVAANYFSQDGFVSAQGGAEESKDAKVKLLYKPSEDFSVLVGAAFQRNKTHSGGINLTQSSPGVIVESDTVIVSGENEFDQYWAEINWDLDFATLTYLPGFRSRYKNAEELTAGPIGLTLKQAEVIPTDDFITHEIHLGSNKASGLSWQIGALYYHNDFEYETSVNIVDSIMVFSNVGKKETTDMGVFGEMTLPLDETWNLTAGLRYNYTKVASELEYTSGSDPFGFTPNPNVYSTVSLAGDEGTSTFNNVTYKLRLEKELSEDSLAYVMVSTGFLPGDVQATTDADNQPIALFYDVESVTAYELGSKNRFLDNSLQVNAALFYYDYDGFQTTANTDLDNPAFAYLISPARMYGLELDAIYQITSSDRLTASFSKLDARFVDQPGSFVAVVGNSEVPNTPDYTAAASYQHIVDLSNGSSLIFKVDARYLGAHLSGNVHPDGIPYGSKPYYEIDPQTIANVSMTWTSQDDNYSVTAYVRNAADNDYMSAGSVVGFSDAAVTPRTVTDADAAKYDPRTFGLVFQARYW